MPSSRHSRRPRSAGRVAAAVAIAGTIALSTVLTTLGGGAATASSHREAPLISADPAVDNTDVYAFVSPDDPNSVTFVANWFGLQEPNGGPTFYPWATDANYDINIDTDGNARPDVGYRLTFRTEDRRGMAAGDKVDANDVDFSPQFPHVALPGNLTAADALGAPANLAGGGTTGGALDNTLGTEGSAGTGGPAAGTTDVAVQPTAASNSWMDDLQALWLAGGLGAVVFAGALAMWFRRRRAMLRANRAAIGRGDSGEIG